jgi:hypothetical protein
LGEPWLRNTHEPRDTGVKSAVTRPVTRLYSYTTRVATTTASIGERNAAAATPAIQGLFSRTFSVVVVSGAADGVADGGSLCDSEAPDSRTHEQCSAPAAGGVPSFKTHSRIAAGLAIANSSIQPLRDALSSEQEFFPLSSGAVIGISPSPPCSTAQSYPV